MLQQAPAQLRNRVIAIKDQRQPAQPLGTISAALLSGPILLEIETGLYLPLVCATGIHNPPPVAVIAMVWIWLKCIPQREAWSPVWCYQGGGIKRVKPG
jgi:hypothetical protein